MALPDDRWTLCLLAASRTAKTRPQRCSATFHTFLCQPAHSPADKQGIERSKWCAVLSDAFECKRKITSLGQAHQHCHECEFKNLTCGSASLSGSQAAVWYYIFLLGLVSRTFIAPRFSLHPRKDKTGIITTVVCCNRDFEAWKLAKG